MVRIGQISYLNCTPIFTMLREMYPDSGYRYLEGVPSYLNQQLREGKVEVCPSSSIEYARNPAYYRFMPDLSISACGAVKSVLLFSRQPLAELNDVRIGLTSQSETSVILLKILLRKFYRLRNDFAVTTLSLAEGLSKFAAVLLIGDQALQESMAAPAGCHVYDLGAEWQRCTGLPFVFALWLVREDWYRQARPEVIRLRDRLLAAKRESLASLEAIAERCQESAGLSRRVLIDYWRTISYDLSPDHLEGVRLYFHYAAECGLIAGEPELKMVNQA
jgi:chorismate dehydratase